ncbi:MAG TPA: ATP-binding protein [Gemmatimonadaceae bacterium]
MKRTDRAPRATAASAVAPALLEEAGRALAAHSPDGIVILTDPGVWNVAFANDVAATLLGTDAVRAGSAFLERFPTTTRSLVERALDAAQHSRTAKDIAIPHEKDDAVLEMRIVALSGGAVVHFRDTSVLALRERQQAAAAAIGLRAISGETLESLFEYAVERVQAALLVDFAYVIELGESQLVVRAHVGRDDVDPVGRTREAEGSIVAYTVETGQPVVTADFDAERRYRIPAAATEVQARSAAAVPIRGKENGFGAIVVMNRARHEFRPEDVAFLQTTANVLAAAVDRAAERNSAEEALRRSEEQLHQAVKMEAVGRLAGGIAHDFNNLLTAIRGYTDLIIAGLEPSSAMRADLTEIQVATERAASLTQQLLAFSRRQVLRPDRIDLRGALHDLERMVRRVIGEDVVLRVTANGTRPVLVDRSQIEQVIINLVINARDAMPHGGSLTIETQDHDVLVQGTRGTPPPGRYVLIRVSDTGSGISPDVIDRIFEPFFTTKGAGKGTGLGLSTAYGTIKQSGGFIYVHSTVGVGTSFTIYLPEASDSAAAAGKAKTGSSRASPGGGETVLVVEDADSVRQVVRRSLTKLGYRVLEASNGIEAIGIAEEHGPRIDLLLSDVVMPQMGGRELVDRIHGLGLTPKILLMSGYVDDAVLRGGGFPSDAAFIEKPFTAEAIGRKVRDILDAGAATPRQPTSQ